MSEADKEIFKVGGSADDVDDDDDQEGGGVHRGRSDKDDGRKIVQRRTSYVDEYRCGGTKSFTKAKKVVLFPFTKVKKHLHHRRKSHKRQPSSSSFGTDAAAVVVDAANESISGNTTKGNSGGVVDACVCFKQPQTLESSVDYRTSDPNDPTFTFDMLKDLIEKNDFYSKECNPHLDFHDISCCDHTTIG